MCLISFAFQAHPEYPLIVVANRDEYRDRPTEPLHWWEGGEILAGRDLQAGGTWLGVSRSGRFAAVTNYREVPTPAGDFLSRGALVSSFLQSDLSPKNYCQQLSQTANQYLGFNLLCIHGSEAAYTSNRHPDGVLELSTGVYGLSNHVLDTPWPKLTQVRSDLSKNIDKGKVVELPDLMSAMLDSTQAVDESLPDTGIGVERERWLSSAYIEGEAYGTRSTSGVSIDRDGVVRSVEWQHLENQPCVSERCEQFLLLGK